MSNRPNVRTPFMLFLALGISSAAMLGCQSDRRDEPFTQSVDVSSDKKIFEGERVFMSTCQQCHPWGSAGYGPSLNSKAFPDFYIDLRVRYGGVGMPAFGKDRIDDDQLAAVVAYVWAIRELKPIH